MGLIGKATKYSVGFGLLLASLLSEIGFVTQGRMNWDEDKLALCRCFPRALGSGAFTALVQICP